MKKETLEEIAERLYPTDYGIKSKDIINIIKQDTFIKGAKWSQERSYSEEEVLNIIDNYNETFKVDLILREDFNQWFDQFKNK